MLGKHPGMRHRNAIIDELKALINHFMHRALFIG